MPENKKGEQDNDEVHDHIPRLGREHEPRGIEKAFCPRDILLPLRLKWDASDHAEDDEDEVSGTEDTNGGLADAFVDGHDAEPEILEEDG